LHHLPKRLTAVVDIGVAAIDTPPSYRSMLEAGLCSVVGFDPQTQFWPKKSSNLTILPDVVGDGRPAKLHVFSAPGMTSVLAPEYAMLNALSPEAAGGPSWGKVIHTEDVQTRRLDDIEAVTAIDFLRMDAQGSELMILQGAQRKLADTVAVQTEVSFTELYVGQPMFGDIHNFLAAQGFIFHTFTEFQVRTIGPSRGKGRHIIQADAVYVKDFRDMRGWSYEQLQHMALIARYCFQSDDLAHRCTRRLEEIDENHGAGEGHNLRTNGVAALSGGDGWGSIGSGNGLGERR
jgi:hypothetical protein